jgi:dUTP pyrophosphatase
LYALDANYLRAGQTRILKTGLAFEVPEGYEIQIRPRSGLTAKSIVTQLGTVDAGYRGEVMVTIINLSHLDCILRPGDRIAQAVIAKVELWTPVECDELSDSDRGGKGFGSSGV